MKIKTSTANRAEECAWCAYPFDAGDRVYLDPGDNYTVFCTKSCVHKHVKKSQANHALAVAEIRHANALAVLAQGGAA